MCWQINVWALNGTQHPNVTHYHDVILAAKRSHAGKTRGLAKGSEGRPSEGADPCDGVQEPAGGASRVISLDKNTADCCRFWKRGSWTHWGWIKPIRLQFEAKLISPNTVKCPERPLGGVKMTPHPLPVKYKEWLSEKHAAQILGSVGRKTSMLQIEVAAN